ncbi:MAG: N-acetylmuramidase family protein, partial [Thermodesulfobacteriota bacterium]
ECRMNRLTQQDYQRAAQELGVEVAVIKSVTAVEAPKGGFIEGTDRPTILFEGHILWQRLEAYGIDPELYQEGNEDVLYPTWTREHYKGGLGEYLRLEKASKIHLPAALESASWGKFQVMGFNWKPLGYPSIDDFVRKMYESEGAHLDAFIRYVQVNGLADSLRGHDWPTFARGYNGKGYRLNQYDTKIASAYQRFKD